MHLHAKELYKSAMDQTSAIPRSYLRLEKGDQFLFSQEENSIYTQQQNEVFPPLLVSKGDDQGYFCKAKIPSRTKYYS